MKITLFDVIDEMKDTPEFKKTAIYSFSYRPETKEKALELSIRKWREALYLIRRGYTLEFMNKQCGLCYVYTGCLRCPVAYNYLCGNVLEFYPCSKENIKEVKRILNYLKGLKV